MIGAAKGSWVVLECYVEAYPEPFVEWIYGDSKVLVESAKHNMSEEVLETRLSATFSRRVLLNITRVESSDFGLYKCEARNQRGRTFGIITLFGTSLTSVTLVAFLFYVFNYRVGYEDAVRRKHNESAFFRDLRRGK